MFPLDKEVDEDSPEDVWSSPHAQLASEMEVLRQEAAEISGLDIETLPPAKLLNGMVRWLFSLLADDRDAKIPSKSLVEACRCYDERLELASVIDSLEAVGATDRLSERDLYHWIVLMFGECSEDEFVGGVNDFGEACRNVKASRLGVTDPNAQAYWRGAGPG